MHIQSNGNQEESYLRQIQLFLLLMRSSARLAHLEFAASSERLRAEERARVCGTNIERTILSDVNTP